MRKLIKGKHLGKATIVDQKTGKETPVSGMTMMMLPAKPGTCEDCATAHKPESPHNAQSLFYQYKFYNEHGRWPNWNDALAHCSEEMKVIWKSHLVAAGVDVEAGRVYPNKPK